MYRKFDAIRRYIKFGTAAGLMSIFVLTALQLRQQYEIFTKDARAGVMATAEAVERSLDSDLRSVAISVASVLRVASIPGELTGSTVSRELERIEDQNPLIAQSTIVGPDGRAVHKEEVLPSAEVDFSDRRYFTFHKERPGDDVFIDGPFVGRLMRRPYITVSQRVEGTNGEFLGVVVAAVDLNAYAALFARLGRSATEELAVFLDDGTMLFREPSSAKLDSIALSETAPFRDHVTNGEAGVFAAGDPVDGSVHYVGLAPVGGFPLVVTASVSAASVAALWQGTLPLEILQSIIVSAAMIALAACALYRLRREKDLSAQFSSEHDARVKADWLRRSVLDALPANVGLIDENGTIIDVNSGWRRFGQAFQVSNGDRDRGANYLVVCDAAAASGDDFAARAGTGLRAVLSGVSARFDMDYPCQSPTGLQWYRLTLSAVEFGESRGAIALHFDVTENKRVEASLFEQRDRLRRLTEGIPGAVFQVTLDADRAIQWKSLSDRGRELFGISSRDALEGGDLLANVVIPDDLLAASERFQNHLLNGDDLDCEFRSRRPDGETRFVRAVAVAGDVGDGRQSDGLFLDVTREREALRKLDYLSTHDVLTGLLNRSEFLRRLDETLAAPGDGKGDTTVLIVGIDDFSDISDAYGLAVGDAAVHAIGAIIADATDAGTTLAQIGGERFGIALEHSTDITAPAILAEKILNRVREPLNIPGHTLMLSASIGIARTEGSASDAASLVTGAERALRVARNGGRGTYRFEEANSGLETQTRLAMRSGLARALANGEFVLHYQPRVRLSDGAVTGCEALLRWQHPVFGMQSPAKFIPVAEHSGQIVPIGKWALEEACRQAKQWLDAGHSHIRIAVNVSAVQVTQSDLAATVETVLAKTGLPTVSLELEMTEAVAFDHSLRGQLERIHALGVSIAIDDFGTGFSSLGTLRSFPLDILKIDQSFVRKALEVEADRVVVGTIVDLARGLKLKTVAEGVETIEQAELLHLLGCDEIQGYYIAVPMEAADFRWFLEAGRERVRRKLDPLYAVPLQIVNGV